MPLRSVYCRGCWFCFCIVYVVNVSCECMCSGLPYPCGTHAYMSNSPGALAFLFCVAEMSVRIWLQLHYYALYGALFRVPSFTPNWFLSTAIKSIPASFSCFSAILKSVLCTFLSMQISFLCFPLLGCCSCFFLCCEHYKHICYFKRTFF